MYKQCWGCNKVNVSIFAWIAGDNVCSLCKKNLSDPKVNENYKINSEKSRMKVQEIDVGSKQKVEKIVKHGKDILRIIFGSVALLWFVVMLSSQQDFTGIVIGWVVIGVIYLVFRLAK